MMKRLASAIVLVSFWLPGAPAHAQYDRDGRYVPSPMGVPADPYARVVPFSPGTPGRVTGTPIQPPGPAPLRAPPVTTMPLDPRAGTSEATLPVPVTRAMCSEGWSVDTGIPKVEFNRRCRRMRPVEKSPDDEK